MTLISRSINVHLYNQRNPHCLVLQRGRHSCGVVEQRFCWNLIILSGSWPPSGTPATARPSRRRTTRSFITSSAAIRYRTSAIPTTRLPTSKCPMTDRREIHKRGKNMDAGTITIICAILGSSALTTVIQAIASAAQKKKTQGQKRF